MEDNTYYIKEYQRLLVENRQLSTMQQVARGQVEELECHGRDIQTVVLFLRSHMPERFDPGGRQSMGDVMVGICRDYLLLRNKSWLERLWRMLEGRVGRKAERKAKAHRQRVEEDED